MRTAQDYAICILGNSQVAALKQAWTNRAPRVATGCTVTFFAAQNHLLEQLECRAGALVPLHRDVEDLLMQTSGGKDHIAFDDYDAFILVGMGFGINVPKLCEECCVVENLESRLVGHLLSHACFAAMIEASLEESLLVQFLDKIRPHTGAPIVACSAPFLSERILTRPPHRGDPRLRDRAFLDLVVGRGRAAASRVAAKRDAEVLWQDDSTVGLPGFTRSEFGVGALILKSEQSDLRDDGKHMNEDYGLLMLTALLRRLDDLSDGRVLAAAGNVVSDLQA